MENIDLSVKKLFKISYASGPYYRMTLFFCEEEGLFYVDDCYEVHDTYRHDRHNTYSVDISWAVGFCISKSFASLRKLRDILGRGIFDEILEKEYKKRLNRMPNGVHVNLFHEATSIALKDGTELIRDSMGIIYKRGDAERWIPAEYSVLRQLIDNGDSTNLY